MKQARYKGKIVSAIDIYNEYNIEIPSVIDDFKKANGKKYFKCIETGIELVFCFGKKNVPHFRYIKGTHINKENQNSCYESKDHEQGIELIYQYLRKFNLGYDIYMDKSIDIGRRANILIDARPKKILIEYIVKVVNYLDWKEKCDQYMQYGFNAIWLIDFKSINDNLNENFDDILYQLGQYNKNSIIYIIDKERRKLIVRKFMEYITERGVFKRSYFIKEYDIDQVEFNLEEGFRLYDFDKEYNLENSKFLEKSDVEYSEYGKKQDHLTERNEMDSSKYSIEVNTDILCHNSVNPYEYKIYPYDKDRYRFLLLNKFKNNILDYHEVYELMSYINNKIDPFKHFFPDKQKAINLINAHLAKLKGSNNREPFVDFESYLKKVDY